PAPAPAAERIGVVHLTAEYWPFARTGGLGEAVSGLATFQAAAGMPTTVVLPLYRQVRATAPSLERAGPPFTVTFGDRSETAWLYREQVGAAQGPQVFFIEHPDFFDRAGIYGDDSGDYPDNALRFAFFCAAALTVLPQIAPEARVLHAHDWHTGLAPVYLRTVFAGEPLHRRLGSVLSVHNAGFQGHFPSETVAALGLPADLYNPRVFEWYGRMNILKGGLTFADLAGKRRCKAALQQAYGLSQGAHAPLFGMSARLVSQKGLDIVLGADLLGTSDAQFIFLGSGEHRYHAALTELAAANPERVAVEFAFTDHLEHGLLAGADLLLMPSLYEPCGLTQMRAQRYGTIPVARRVGGLHDSIADGETGFLFNAYEPAALEQAVQRALAGYRDRAAWRTIMRRAMDQQFGWDGSAARYLDVYRRALAL